MTIRTANDKSTILQVDGVDKVAIREDGAVEAEYFKTPGGVLSPVGAFKNKIINGAPIVDIRRPTPITDTSGSSPFIADRWRMITRTGASLTGGIYTSGAGSSWRHLAITVNSSKSPAASDQFRLSHGIEGTVIGDWRLGSSLAKVVTLSFETCHSVAGTYSGALYSTTASRSFVFEYTQAVANEWERHFVTIQLDTTGTWTIDASAMLTLSFDYGTGSQYETSNTGVWQEGTFLRSSSSLRPITTAGALVRFQAIQLEEGPYATPFEQRFITVEEALCERYYSTGELVGSVYATNTTSELLRIQVRHRQIMRAIPTVNLSYISGNAGSFAVYRNNTKGFNVHFTKTGADTYLAVLYSYVADAEL